MNYSTKYYYLANSFLVRNNRNFNFAMKYSLNYNLSAHLIAHFYAVFCPPCQMFIDVFSYNIEFYKRLEDLNHAVHSYGFSTYQQWVFMLVWLQGKYGSGQSRALTPTTPAKQHSRLHERQLYQSLPVSSPSGSIKPTQKFYPSLTLAPMSQA